MARSKPFTIEVGRLHQKILLECFLKDCAILLQKIAPLEREHMILCWRGSMDVCGYGFFLAGVALLGVPPVSALPSILLCGANLSRTCSRCVFF